VTTAFAASQQSVALLIGSDQGSGFVGTYGDPITLQPASMTSIELPKDKFHYQVYCANDTSQGVSLGMQWTDTEGFEDVQLEDTNTVQPFTYALGIDDAVILGDGSVASPVALLTTATIGYTPFTTSTYGYLIRCQYEPLGSSTTPPSYSETETVRVIKNSSTAVSFSKSGTVKHAGTTFNFHVSPDCGSGTITVTVAKSGAKTLTYNVTTDEDGAASATLKLGTKNGTYKVSARFLGNIYGVASKTVSKSFVANH
jgi:hypothetical protein